MNCMHKDCTKAADHKVRLSLRAHLGHQPAVSTPMLYVCEDHADVSWDDVVDADDWELICNQFENIGKARPKKEYSFVLVEPIMAGMH